MIQSAILRMMNTLRFSITCIIYFCISMIWVCGFASADAGLRVEHHLEVELFPGEKKLIGIDRIIIQADGNDMLTFRLSEKIDQIAIEVGGKKRKFIRQHAWLQVPLRSKERQRSVRVTIRYSGIFDDPVPIRPLNTDNPGFGVSATISEKGSFLLAGSCWYPELSEGQAIYSLNVRAPAGMIAVTAGQSMGHQTEDGKTVSRWKVDYPVEGLSISAAPYVVREKKVGAVTAATYFLSADRQLSDAYLEATANYLSLYSDLFGPYPFKKFAVVENFFPTGYGFPSYTLLGSAVLRLPFIIYNSLGHEIAHCWWGNGVYVDYEGGNWSEALTTYVADYFYKEKKSESAARNYRLQALRNYAALVKPQNDFALNRFISRHDPVTKTIGYDKGLMVFHMLRQLLGENAFWGALRHIYRQRLFQPTAWTNLQQAFEKRSNRSLQTFFDQWVHRKGAPRFYLDGVSTEHSDGRWRIKGRILQQRPYYRFKLKLMLESRNQKIFKNLNITADQSTPFMVGCENPPRKLILDPDVDMMRRLFDSEIPPSINALKSSASVLFVLSDNIEPALREAAEILALSLGLKTYEIVSESNISQTQLHENDILMIGNPKKKELLRRMPNELVLHDQAFALNQKSYDGTSDVFFGVFTHPYVDDRVAALFWPLSSDHAERVARKITHYGKYSYLAFQNGNNQDKGFWQINESPLVYQWNQKTD